LTIRRKASPLLSANSTLSSAAATADVFVARLDQVRPQEREGERVSAVLLRRLAQLALGSFDAELTQKYDAALRRQLAEVEAGRRRASEVDDVVEGLARRDAAEAIVRRPQRLELRLKAST
jgi:hypothetical protein